MKFNKSITIRIIISLIVGFGAFFLFLMLTVYSRKGGVPILKESSDLLPYYIFLFVIGTIAFGAILWRNYFSKIKLSTESTKKETGKVFLRIVKNIFYFFLWLFIYRYLNSIWPYKQKIETFLYSVFIFYLIFFIINFLKKKLVKR